jgi:glucose/arabinose dehydrogenase
MPGMRRALPLALLIAAALGACGGGGDKNTAPAHQPQSPPTSGRPSDGASAGHKRLPTGTVVNGLTIPWALAFLPDRSALVTERPGRVLRLDKRLRVSKTPVARIDVDATGEGGLLGLAVDPRFKSNHFVYLYRTTPTGNQVVRYRYASRHLTEPTVVVRGIKAGVIHDGGRLRFGPDGALYITTGETGDGALAQQPDSLNGKILRVKDPREGAVEPEIVSLGHRNVQGLDWQPGTDLLYATEFGPDAHDEVNQIREGQNYGWPDDEGKEGPGPALIDYEQIVAPSGATFVHKEGSRWSGDLLVACLRGEQLRRITFSGTAVARDQPLYEGRYGRLRDVVEGPDGGIYVLTNNTDGRGTPRKGDDRIVRIVPPRD